MAFSFIRTIINKFAHSHRSSAITGPFGLVPPEVLDLIIGYLTDDKVTLLSCALVHPAWTSISRYHLPPVTLIVSSPSRSKDLCKLLRSSQETLSSSVTGITLVGDVPFDDCATNGKSSRSQSYRKLLHVLKAKHVALCSGAVENDPSLLEIFAYYFPALSELKVTCASYQDITSFMRALAGAFTRLTALSIELGSRGLDLPDASLSGLHDLALGMPRLRSLRVSGWNNDLVRWLGNNVVGTLERLELESTSVWSTCHVDEATPLLQRNKDTLKDLKLSFVKRDAAFDLSGLTRLARLEVTSGMSEALNGRLLPRSLEKLSIREAACALASSGMSTNLDMEECILLEGPALQRAMGL
ncbi:hypothetical protein CPB85DRAFT_1439240 [Mucidula mucida]|nr:hypothetical protein CPB85DRAFT_1439240 [Mucidula mucida]